MTDLIIFDVGGVVLRMDFRTMFHELAQHSRHSVDEIKRRFAQTAIDKHLMIGDEPELYFGKVRAILESDVSDEELLRILKLSIPEPIPEMLVLKRKLHEAGYIIGIISNIAQWAHEYLDEDWPEVLQNWDGPRTLSYQRRCIKPDADAYNGFEADRIIFIDDKSSYLKHPVEDLGWIGIQLTAYRDLDEPIRHAGSNHQDDEIASERFHIAHTVADVERILKNLGLTF